MMLIGALAGSTEAKAEVGDTLWLDYSDRFVEDQYYALSELDSIAFRKSNMKTFRKSGINAFKSYMDGSLGIYTFEKPDRFIVKPNTYSSNDYSKETSKFCIQRSAESEHFIIFWEKGLNPNAAGNISLGGFSVNVKTLLMDAEKIWKCYVEELGFLTPGSSTTDKAKIEMYIVNQTDWRADGSGTSGTIYTYNGTTKSSKSYQVGMFHCNPWAATGRNGHTVAHEIGHTFQYLVSADLGSTHGLNYVLGENSKGNEWWEDCANWQAYKVYPSYQYSDGEYYEGFLTRHHMNIHHEDIRYFNCFYQDWWCQQHGMNTVGRVWREAKRPEDPSQAYMRIFGLDTDGYAKEMYDAFSHLVTIDIDKVRDYGKAKIGQEPQRLKEASADFLAKYLDNDNSWWVVDADYCPQNYGYNANPLKVPAAGTVVKATFRGLAGSDGYRKVKTEYAGWRYGFVAYCADGTRVYSDMQSDKNGEATITVPENCQNLWFVVMGAPTTYWAHSWNDDVSDDEQWPYAVKFEGTDAYGASKNHGEYPDDYVRRDTTVVINAKLSYSGSSYSSVLVQYDMDAVSEALGVSTATMKAVKVGKKNEKNYLRFAGLNANGVTETNNNTTTTSSSTVLGHWFTTTGNVTTYGNTSAIFAEMTPNNFECKVGQYPGKLQKNKTYIIRQAFIYTDANGTEYKAIMEVHLNVI